MPMKNPPHPGDFVLRQCIEPLRLTIEDAAAALGVTRTTLSELVNGKRGISPEMAVRLSKVFGGSAESWIIQQAHYDVAQVRADRIKLKRLQLSSSRAASGVQVTRKRSIPVEHFFHCHIAGKNFDGAGPLGSPTNIRRSLCEVRCQPKHRSANCWRLGSDCSHTLWHRGNPLGVTLAPPCPPPLHPIESRAEHSESRTPPERTMTWHPNFRCNRRPSHPPI